MQNLLVSQTAAISKLSLLKVGALFKRPGTGKSRTGVELIKSAPVNYVLWLAPYGSVHPKIAGSGIKDEVIKWWNSDMKIDFIAIESIQQSDRIYLETYHKVENNKTFIVCDESLFIKNQNAKRTKRLTELSKMCEYKLILNGTPISRNLLDIWAQMDFLSPKILNMGYAEFKNTFCEYTNIKRRFGNRWATKEFITGYENIDYLYSLIRPYVYEADLQLEVGQQHIRMSYDIEPEMKAEYQRLKEMYLDNEKLMMMNNNIFLELTMKMQHLYSCAEDKFNCVDVIMKEHGKENIIMYAKFVDSQQELRKRYPDVPVLSIQSDCRSLNLQDRHVTIEFDKTWDFGLVDQYKFRTYRTGQQKDCYYYYLDGDVNLEWLMQQNNERKCTQLNYFKSITKEELKQVL